MEKEGQDPSQNRAAVIAELKNAETLLDEETENGMLSGEFSKFENLDITNEDINFEEIDELMSKFESDPMMKEAMTKGIDIREYWKQVESDLRKVEQESLHDHMAEAQKITELYQLIQSCDNILETMENLLSKFQGDLGNISEEIRYLQQQSTSMSVKLKNRKVVADDLAEFVTDLAVPQVLVQNICTAKVNEAYVEYLTQLHKKITFLETQEKNKVVSARDVSPDLEKLKLKALVKIREFLLQNIYSLRKPGTNIQIIQSSRLLKFKTLNRFLYKYSKEYASEVRNAYEETMGKIYATYFKEYISGLMKLLDPPCGGKNDLLGAEENEMKGFFSSKFAKTRANVFSLGFPSRADLLQDLEEPQIVLNEAVQSKVRHPFEVLFRSMNHYLKDAVTAEYFFDQEFFGKIDLFNSLFGKPVQMLTENALTFVANSYDAIGILILINIIDEYKDVLKARKVAWLNPYHDKLLSHLWERFLIVFNMHLESLSTINLESVCEGGLDIRPHYITRRYAEFSTAVGSLIKPPNQNKVIKHTEDLRKRMENLVVNMAKSKYFSTKKNRLIFLINNYDHILSVHEGRHVENAESSRFRSLLDTQIAHFVEIELEEYYSKLIQFVKSTYPLLEDGRAQPDQQLVSSLVSEFASNWKQVLDQIRKDVLTYFSNFLTGSNVLKQVLSQLALYYNRFEEIIRKCFKQSTFKDFVPTPTLTYQIKKVSIAF